jgi:hypothetical protein
MLINSMIGAFDEKTMYRRNAIQTLTKVKLQDSRNKLPETCTDRTQKAGTLLCRPLYSLRAEGVTGRTDPRACDIAPRRDSDDELYVAVVSNAIHLAADTGRVITCPFIPAGCRTTPWQLRRWCRLVRQAQR